MVRRNVGPLRIRSHLSTTLGGSAERTLGQMSCSTQDLLLKAEAFLIRRNRIKRQRQGLLIDEKAFRTLSLIVRIRLDESNCDLQIVKDRLLQTKIGITSQEQERLLRIAQLARETNRARADGIARIIRATEGVLATRRRSLGLLEQRILQLENEIPKLQDLLRRLSRLEGEDETAAQRSQRP